MSIQKSGIGIWEICISDLNSNCGFLHKTEAIFFFDSEDKKKAQFTKGNEEHPDVLQ